jgi:hypothetical protein
LLSLASVVWSGALIHVNVCALCFAVRSIVFVLRRNVQLVQPEVSCWYHDYSILNVMSLLEESINGSEQCGATDNTTCASWYAWACVLHDVRTSGAVLGGDLLSGILVRTCPS